MKFWSHGKGGPQASNFGHILYKILCLISDSIKTIRLLDFYELLRPHQLSRDSNRIGN